MLKYVIGRLYLRIAHAFLFAQAVRGLSACKLLALAFSINKASSASVQSLFIGDRDVVGGGGIK